MPTAAGAQKLEAPDAGIDRDERRRAVRIRLGRHPALPPPELEHDPVTAGADRDLAERRAPVRAREPLHLGRVRRHGPGLLRALQEGPGLVHGRPEPRLRLGPAVVDQLQRAAHDRPGHVPSGIRVGQHDAPDAGVRHDEEVALEAEHRAAVADDTDAAQLLEQETHTVPGVCARPDLTRAPRQEVLLGHERRAVRQTPPGQLEADVARVIARARPRAAGGPHGNDRAIRGHVDGHVVERQVPGVGGRVLRAQRLLERERGPGHAERTEHLVTHDRVVGLAELTGRCDRAGADVAGGRGERVAVLVERAEVGRGPHAGEEIELCLGRRSMEGEEPFQVPPGQARARAEQMLHEDARGHVGIADPEGGMDLCHRGVPAEAALVDEPGQHQRRQRLGVGRDHVEGVGGDGLGAAALAHAEAVLDQHRVLLEEHDGEAGHVGDSAHLVDEPPELGHARGVERTRRSPGPALDDVSGRTQALGDERQLRAAALGRGHRDVTEHDHGQRALAREVGRDPSRLRRRGPVRLPVEHVPAVASGRVRRGGLLAVEARPAPRPRRGDRVPHVGAARDLHDLDRQLLLRVPEGEAVVARGHRPVAGHLERGPGRQRQLAIHRRRLGRRHGTRGAAGEREQDEQDRAGRRHRTQISRTGASARMEVNTTA